ncbi:major facilitator superfamily domain-containing protein [Zopfochytrium polystomum]|nr:major facilitator superfamily domain-containing protein [Zopfochytrium polystomum]KAI9337732.1 major facilitator superfamily domain-containing protein [Zopfochytrium polystomum]
MPSSATKIAALVSSTPASQHFSRTDGDAAGFIASSSVSSPNAEGGRPPHVEPLSVADDGLAEPLAGQEGGVLQARFVADGLAPASTMVWVGSVQTSFEAMIAVPGARLVEAYGPRRVALIGTLLVAAGSALGSFFTESVPGLIVTEGIMFGLGQALCFFAAATLPSAYFLRRRNLATGIVFAGSGPPLDSRILGALMLLVNLPAALVLRTRTARAEPMGGAGRRMFKWFVCVWGPRFTLLLVGSSVALFPLFVPPFFLPLYATSVGLSPTVASVILAGFNLASAFGRLGFGLFADSLLGSLNTLVVCLLLVGVSTLAIWPVATTMGPLIVFAVVNGLCAGGMFSLIPGTVANIFGSRDLSEFFSLIIFFWLPGYFLGSPIAGYLLQAFGGPEAGLAAYRPAIFYSGALSLASAVCVLAVRVLQDKRLFKKI